MRSVLHALIWNHFRHTFWMQATMLATCFFPMLIYAAIISVAPDSVQGQDPVRHLLEVSMLSFVIFILVMGAGASHANMTQLFTKPLSNLTIAAWRTISGTVLLGIQIGLLAWFYNRMFHAGWPVMGAVLFTIAVWFAAQPFFCLAGKSVAVTAVTMIPIALMVGWFYTRYRVLVLGGQASSVAAMFQNIQGIRRDWTELSWSEGLQLSAVIIVFAWCTLKSVALARRGDSLPLPALWSGLWQYLSDWQVGTTRPRRPFRSPAMALFWYEWRWKGWALTVSMLFMLVLILPSQLIRHVSLESFYSGVTAAYLATMPPAFLLGMINGFQLESMQISASTGRLSNGLDEIDCLRSFQATRPVSDAVLARSNLWVSLASIGLVTGLWLILAGPVLAMAVSTGEIAFLLDEYPVHAVPLIAAAMWVVQANLTMITSTGRTKWFTSGATTIGLTFFGLVALCQWLGTKSLALAFLNITFVLATLALAAFGIWAYVRSWQLGFVSQTGAAAAAIVAAAVVAIGCFQSVEVTLYSVMGLICAGILIVLPWAATPLATRWNRHR